MKVVYNEVFPSPDDRELQGHIFKLVGINGSTAIVKEEDGSVWSVPTSNIQTVDDSTTFKDRQYYLDAVNKLGKELYGDHLHSLPYKALKKIVEENRGSGQTTAKALRLISEAISNPGKPVPIAHDHGYSDVLRKHMCDVVKELIQKLDFKYLEIKYSDYSLTYDI